MKLKHTKNLRKKKKKFKPSSFESGYSHRKILQNSVIKNIVNAEFIVLRAFTGYQIWTILQYFAFTLF